MYNDGELLWWELFIRGTNKLALIMLIIMKLIGINKKSNPTETYAYRKSRS